MPAGYTFAQIASIVNGRLVERQKDAVILHLLTDSRKLGDASATAFFALPGPRRSGERFVKELYERGVRNFITTANTLQTDLPEANMAHVPDVLVALQQLAGYHRSQFTLPVIGITGSNGKTIVKEWLNQMMEEEHSIVRSPKSYNSQIGVPLSVWQITAQHTLGIFEAGISQPGEMERLQQVIQPTVGVFTNLGDAHSENFTSQQQKAAEKVKLFKTAGYVVANGYSPIIIRALKDAGLNYIAFGTNNDCQIQVVNVKTGPHNTRIRLTCNTRQQQIAFDDFEIDIPFTDDASIENAISCCSVLLTFQYPPATIQKRLQLVKPVSMRLELKKGINQCSVVNDSYVADSSSLKIALDFLQQQPQPKKTVILSDLLQTGASEENLYQQIASLLTHKHIERLIGIGPAMVRYQGFFSTVISETAFYPSTEDFLNNFHSNQFKNEAILIKGARKFVFERICAALDQKAHQTVLEINLTHVLHNLHQHQRLLQPSTKIMVMVKAFSYGSGSFEIANLLQFQKVDYLAVAYTDEGVELRNAGITLPIMVMNPEETSFAAMAEHYLEPEIFSLNLLQDFLGFLKQEGLQQYPVHIKMDTGMHRLGFELKDIPLLSAQLRDNPLLKVQSVFSHLAGSEDAQLDYFTQQQVQVYNDACRQLQKVLPYPFIKHISNSAAIARHPALHFDMVRLGIGLYGVNTAHAPELNLKEAVTLKTTIAQIKKLPAGETVGYGRKGVVNKETLTATIRIGYADGYRRSLSNSSGKVLVNNQLAPVIGNIAMDMTMIDITGIEGVSEQDEVILFGPDLSVDQVALWAGTIPYEILTGISQRVQRVYFEE